jgi:hypothetical protein
MEEQNIQTIFRNTAKLGYDELGYNEQILGQIGHFSTRTNLVITNPSYNEQKWPLPSCSL